MIYILIVLLNYFIFSKTWRLIVYFTLVQKPFHSGFKTYRCRGAVPGFFWGWTCTSTEKNVWKCLVKCEGMEVPMSGQSNMTYPYLPSGKLT